VLEFTALCILHALVGSRNDLPVLKTGGFLGFSCRGICQVFDQNDDLVANIRRETAEASSVN
jgi:hypothetical protein